MGIFAALVLASCSPEEQEPIPFESIASGATPASGEIQAGGALAYQIFADSTAWSAFWRRSFATPVPEVRFEDEFVLRVEWGTQPTGGYGVEIRTLKLDGKSGTLYVGLGLKEPGPDDMVTQALTTPYAVVRVPRAGRDRDLPTLQFSRLDGTERRELQARRLEPTAAGP